jgi:hypothetical protein
VSCCRKQREKRSLVNLRPHKTRMFLVGFSQCCRNICERKWALGLGQTRTGGYSQLRCPTSARDLAATLQAGILSSAAATGIEFPIIRQFRTSFGHRMPLFPLVQSSHQLRQQTPAERDAPAPRNHMICATRS